MATCDHLSSLQRIPVDSFELPVSIDESVAVARGVERVCQEPQGWRVEPRLLHVEETQPLTAPRAPVRQHAVWDGLNAENNLPYV